MVSLTALETPVPGKGAPGLAVGTRSALLAVATVQNQLVAFRRRETRWYSLALVVDSRHRGAYSDLDADPTRSCGLLRSIFAVALS